MAIETIKRIKCDGCDKVSDEDPDAARNMGEYHLITNGWIKTVRRGKHDYYGHYTEWWCPDCRDKASNAMEEDYDDSDLPYAYTNEEIDDV